MADIEPRDDETKEVERLRRRVADLEAELERNLRQGEAKFAAAFHASADSITITSADGTLLDANEGFERLFGYDRREVIGRSSKELEIWADPEQRDAVVAQFRRDGRVRNFQALGRTKAGRIFPAEVSVEPLEIDGQPAMLGEVRDVSAHKQAEEALRASEARYRAYVDLAPTAVFVADAQGRYVDVNPAACALLGYTHDELCALSIPAILPAGTPLKSFRKLKTHGSVREDRVLVRKDGSRVHVDLAAAKLDDDRLMAFCSDITERKQLQLQLAQADRMASVGLLAAGVAHEINNPLSYVLYNLETLAEELPELVETTVLLLQALGKARADEVLGEAAQRCTAEWLEGFVSQAEQATEGAGRVRDIVKDLKTFARVDDERVVPVSVNAVLDSALSMAFNEIKYRARVVKDYGDLPMLLANDGKLAQVFLNLLINACHAIEEGKVEQNEICLRSRTEDKQICIEIRDSGCGIAQERLDAVFDAFYTTKEIGVGSGLGLTICQNLMQAMGGTISLESEPGRGTSAWVRLPIESPRRAPPVTSGRTPAATRRCHILVIDDEPNIGRVVTRMLAKHDVEAVTSGREAKERLAADQSYDMIICDLMMPDLTGMDLHSWLTQEQPTLAERMVFVTGGAFTPHARQFLDAVANARVEKPFTATTIRRVLQDLVDRQPAKM